LIYGRPKDSGKTIGGQAEGPATQSALLRPWLAMRNGTGALVSGHDKPPLLAGGHAGELAARLWIR